MLGLLALGAFPRVAGLERSLVRREVVVAFLAAAAGFVLGTPGAVLEPRAFLSDLAFNAQTRHEYKGLVGEATSWGAYLGLAGDALTLARPRGGGRSGWRWPSRAAWRGSRALLVVALAALAPYALVASSGHRAMRFLAPALPAAAWLAALALASLPRRRARRLLTTALLARSAVAAVLVLRLFFVDSRLRAERWMEAHVPRGATVDVITNHEGYVPRVPEGRVTRVVRTLSREMAPAERFEEAARAYPSEAAEWLVLTGCLLPALPRPPRPGARARPLLPRRAGGAGRLRGGGPLPAGRLAAAGGRRVPRPDDRGAQEDPADAPAGPRGRGGDASR